MMSSECPDISVILPVYNAESTLQRAVDSILAQQFSDFEFIIVNDGSTDGTGEIIREYEKSDARIKPIVTKHRGIVHALNTGLKHARGTFIARMDADDYSHPERFGEQRKWLLNHPRTGLVSCLVEYEGDKEKYAGYARYVKWINTLTEHESISLNRFIESPVAHPSVMYRKDLLENFGSYKAGAFPEDYELWLRWLEQGVRMQKIDRYLFTWRDLPGRLSRTHSRYSVESFYRIKAKYLARWLQRYNPHHPEVIIWGAGRTTRKRADLLTGYNIKITHYIDIDPNKIGHVVHGRPVLGPDEIPSPAHHYVVSFVGRRGAHDDIHKELEKHGYKTGKNCIFAA